jgi:ATP-binding cassette subfamily C protein
MLGIIRIFFRENVANPWVVLLALLAAGFAGGIGVGSLLPLISVTAGGGAETDTVFGRAVTDALATVGLTPTLLPILMIVVGGITVKCLLTLAAMRYVAHASAAVTTLLRAQLLRSLLNAEWSHFITQPIGTIANAASLEATRSGRAYTMAANFLANAIQALIYIGVAFAVSWKLSVLAVVFGVGIAAALQFLVRMAKQAGLRETTRTRELLVFLTDAFNSIKPLKAMAKQGHFAALCDAKIRSLNKALRRQITTIEARRNLEEILTAICLGGAFYVAVSVYGYTLSEVLVVGVLLSQTTRNIGRIQDNLQKAAVVESPYRALRKMIAEAEAAQEHAGGSLKPRLERGCVLEDVSFSYPGKAVLQNAHLEIEAGRTTVLLGPSGSGKTTLTDLIAGLLRPTGGDIQIDGVSLQDIDLAQWRKMIGYVPQELVLFHDTIAANVTLGNPTLGEEDVRAALRAAGALEFVDGLNEGIHSTVGEKGFKLSGGQRQRIALARALATRPRLLILDEVTSALDPKTEADLCQSLKSLKTEARRLTILAITHRPAFLDIADRVYRVTDGRVEPVPPPPAQPRLEAGATGAPEAAGRG